MGRSTGREDLDVAASPPPPLPAEAQPEPETEPAVEDELGLLGRRDVPRDEGLDLPAEPEDYFSPDPHHPRRELL